LLGKQTLRQLSLKYDRSIPWIKKQLDAFEPEARYINPSIITLVADATFHGKKSDRLGTLVFKDILNNKIVACKHIETETANDYKQLVAELIEQGFIIQGVTIDGKRGVAKAFADIPVQMCHFHQIAIIKRYLTSRPKLEASIELLKICRRIPTTTQTRFTDALSQWHDKHKAFLNEKTLNPTTLKYVSTHAKLVAAYRSLTTNLPYLFTYKNLKEFNMPNTTNALDGGVFSQLKKLIKLHQGLAKKRKVKLIDEFLDQYNKKR
jgi:hypothetical protein